MSKHLLHLIITLIYHINLTFVDLKTNFIELFNT